MLLDVNVLLALAWPNHQFHGRARAWFTKQAPRGWSTCAITQLGFVRISSNPSFTEHAKSPLEAVLILNELTDFGRHRYLEALPPVGVQPEAWDLGLGHRQTTDLYLALAARHHDTRLATFDRRLASSGIVNDAVFMVE